MNLSMNGLRPLTMAIAGAICLAQFAAQAQTCKVNKNGCVTSGALCSPVTTGFGPTGKCSTTGPAQDRDCSCQGAVVPPVNPDCMNPAKKGHIVCTINQPVVTQADTVYSSVIFLPGDHVSVQADGCVQTGGHGLTWKRYVNPSMSATLYHGTIYIPNFTPTLRTIQSMIGLPIVIPPGGVRGAPLLLHLGYIDDNYSDNGYYSHDDGTYMQCRTNTPGFDGGPAHVTITIDRR